MFKYACVQGTSRHRRSKTTLGTGMLKYSTFIAGVVGWYSEQGGDACVCHTHGDVACTGSDRCLGRV